MFKVLATPPISWLGLCKTPVEGAQTSIYCAISPDVENACGSYFLDCRVKKSSALTNDEQLAKRVWEESERLVYKKQ
jgi:hypothetical protein